RSFFDDPASTDSYALSLHDALPISAALFRRAFASLFFLLNLVHTTQDFTAEDPNFDADGAVRGLRTNRGIINICTQGVQRHAARSEEHTSELQSRENLVCRLLLEKK